MNEPQRPSTRDAMARARATLVRFGRPLLLLVPVLYVITFGPAVGGMHPGDAANAYLQAGDAIRSGTSMYEPLPPEGPHRVGNYYLYPPPLGALVGVLPAIHPDTFQAVVLITNVLATWVFAWTLARLARLPAFSGTLGMALLLLHMPGLGGTIAIGNIDPIVFAFVGLGLVLPTASASAALSLGTALKVTPIWALGVFLVRCGRRAWIGFALATLACLAVIVLAVGFGGLIHETLLWATRVAPTLSQGQYEVLPILVGGEVRSGLFVNGNISLAFLPVRLLTEPPPIGEPIPLAARAYLTLVQFGVPALVAYRTRALEGRLQAAWVVFAATLAAPIMRGGYLPVLLVVPALLLGRRRAHAERLHGDA